MSRIKMKSPQSQLPTKMDVSTLELRGLTLTRPKQCYSTGHKTGRQISYPINQDRLEAEILAQFRNLHCSTPYDIGDKPECIFLINRQLII
jgi:hypothetical protein